MTHTPYSPHIDDAREDDATQPVQKYTQSPEEQRREQEALNSTRQSAGVSRQKRKDLSARAFGKQLQRTPNYIDIIRARKGWDMTWFSDVNYVTDVKLDGLDKAVNHLHECITNSREITIITDFDMDGVSAGTLIYAGLAELGAHVNLVIPDYKGPREIVPADIDQAVDFYPDTALIITCDAGVNSNAAIHHAQNTHRIDVMVTDHHVELDPGCAARFVLNPNRIGSTYPQPDICGAQVAYMLIREYTLTYAREKMHDIARLELFAGIGSLTDVMPLVHWTRKLVRTSTALMKLCTPRVPENKWGGFDQYKAAKTDIDSATLMGIIKAPGTHHTPEYIAAFEGVAYMLRGLIEKKKLTSLDNINESFIGFTVGPMFNATRRVGGDMRDTFAIFTPKAVEEQYPKYTIDRADAVLTVIANNERRKALTKQAMSQMTDNDQPFAPIVFFIDAPAGILGLIAANIMRETTMPAIALNPNTLKGSARAPQWFNVIDTAAELSLPGLQAVGHQQACGFSATNHDQLRAFVDTALQKVAATPQEIREPGQADLHLCDTIPTASQISSKAGYRSIIEASDGVIADTQDLIDLSHQLDIMAPFGHGFTYPDIRITAVTAMCTIKTMGSANQHMKITLDSGMVLLWWNAAEKLDELQSSEMFTATVELGVNEFMGVLSAQGVVGTMTFHSTGPHTEA